jgi:hypothetical protein
MHCFWNALEDLVLHQQDNISCCGGRTFRLMRLLTLGWSGIRL